MRPPSTGAVKAREGGASKQGEQTVIREVKEGTESRWKRKRARAREPEAEEERM